MIKTSKNINKVVSEAVKIAKDDTHGYDQLTRTGGIDYDCSSLVSHCLIVGGFDINKNSTTRNLYTQLLNNGFKEIKDIKNRKKGDIFLTPGKHVVIAKNKNDVVTASINEKGTATGGKPGDQTGKEIYIRKFYIPSYNWTYHMRFDENKEKVEDIKTQSNTDKITRLALETISGKHGNGSTRKIKLGKYYKKVQKKVNEILSKGWVKTW